ncbi:MAG: hypothetical protein GY754_27430 [bacterium]|nr:hypothetical protein [bacterium]
MYNITGIQMLKNRLLSNRDLPSYLKEKYDYKGKTNSFLKKRDSIHELKINSKIHNLPEKLYHDTSLNPGSPNAFDIALSLKKKSFLTGYLVFAFLGWTEYIPTIIHVNWKRNLFKKTNSPIVNDVLQKVAFKPKKASRLRFKYNDYEIMILNGQVIKKYKQQHFRLLSEIAELPDYTETYVEERLIIESLINYHYFGGADIVWDAGIDQFLNLDLDLMYKIYKELDLIYPYANAIGYWMEKAGVSQKYLRKWEKMIDYNMQFHMFMGDGERRVWNKKWNLYVSKRFI